MLGQRIVTDLLCKDFDVILEQQLLKNDIDAKDHAFEISTLHG